mmetsp:Transcript_34783/g.55870  ORF Transcript_34783/g.55870 Transcript_34783/m.55870 type:complete len:336 (+) Transcript_34783:137-1144(+)
MMQQDALTVVRVERGTLKRSSSNRLQLETSATAASSNHCHIEEEDDDTKLTEFRQTLGNDVLSEIKQWMERKKQMRKFSRKKRTNSGHVCFELDQICSLQIAFHPLFIFDWDDTIFPTSVLHRDRMLEFDQDELEALSQDLHQLIDGVISVWRAIKKRNGEIKIITSATTKWMERIFNGDYSETLLPIFQRLQKAMEESGIEIISARDKYVTKQRNKRRSRNAYKGRKAKAECMQIAFADFKKRMEEKPSAVPVVYSIGDGMDEWNGSLDAFEAVFGCQFESISLLERIKLEKKPESIGYMTEQMETVRFIINSDTDTKYLQYIMTEHQVIDYIE